MPRWPWNPHLQAGDEAPGRLERHARMRCGLWRAQPWLRWQTMREVSSLSPSACSLRDVNVLSAVSKPGWRPPMSYHSEATPTKD